MERLAAMVNDAKRPVQFVFAGKAHPHDEPGKRVLQQIAQMMRNSDFADKFVFIEDYDINVGRYLVQGVDVWLNNPRRPLEASGTSGMKVVLNGGLNLSVLDGWWAEAYDGLNGFAIGTGRTHSNMDVHDSRDGEALYRVLLDEVIPLYYQRDRDGLPRGWIKRMKRTIRTLGWRFNADRMVMDYTLKCYIPAGGGTSSEVRTPVVEADGTISLAQAIAQNANRGYLAVAPHRVRRTGNAHPCRRGSQSDSGTRPVCLGSCRERAYLRTPVKSSGPPCARWSGEEASLRGKAGGAARRAIDEGDASGIAEGDVFAQVRKTLRLQDVSR